MADDRHGIDAEPGGADAPFGSEPSIEAMIQKALDGFAGWGEIDGDAKALMRQRAEQQAAAKRQANDFRDCFSTIAGRRVLEHMLDMTLRASPYPTEAQLPMDVITPLVIVHDAQCNFVRAIVAAIQAAGGLTNPTEGEQDGHRNARPRATDEHAGTADTAERADTFARAAAAKSTRAGRRGRRPA